MVITVFQKHSSHILLSPQHLEKIQLTDPSVKILLTDNFENEDVYSSEIVIALGPLTEIPIEKMRKLKWIHLSSAGANMLTTKILSSDVVVTNSSGVHPIPIAEHVFAFMLMFARGMHLTYRHQIIHRSWMEDKSSIPVFELHGKTIAVVGMGRIGTKVAELAKGFGMSVLGVVNNTAKPRPHADELYSLDRLDELLPKSDFVINCLPGTKETMGIFDNKKFSRMKNTAYFINIGRGFSTIEDDVIDALKNGDIAGAGLDVFETEPLSDSSPLWNMENVIITPHSSGRTPLYTDRVVEIFCENLSAYLKNEHMPNKVDKKKGY